VGRFFRPRCFYKQDLIWRHYFDAGSLMLSTNYQN
jgi:hypothetical protein